MTLNLKAKDIDAATEAKHRLEEKQRAEARERKEKEMQWETRVSVSSVPLLLNNRPYITSCAGVTSHPLLCTFYSCGMLSPHMVVLKVSSMLRAF